MELIIGGEHRYTLIEENKIENSTGALYEALDLKFGRRVAVKSVRLSGESPNERRDSLKKAEDEVLTMIKARERTAKIPFIMNTHFDREKGIYYIVMEWVEGKTLRDLLKESGKRLPERQFISYMIELCNILFELQKKRPSIIHKDIKPENIMLRASDRSLVLIDFNISASMPNLIEGTANYKAPEMSPSFHSPSRDRVDIFSVGVLLYEYYTGEAPVMGRDYAIKKLFRSNEWARFTSPRDKSTETNAEINEIIIKCMKLNPSDRCDIGELRRGLTEYRRRLK